MRDGSGHFYGFAASVPTAYLAHPVRPLDRPATRACALGRRGHPPSWGPAAAALGLRGFLLGYGHRTVL